VRPPLDSSLSVELALPAEWGRIEPTREAVGLLIKAMFGDADLEVALGMVSAELLENAVKYSKPSSHLRLSVRAEGSRVVIAVTNAVDGDSSHLDALRSRFAWLANFATPAEAYCAALERFSEHLKAEDRGLGIFRIAYEGGCGVDFDVSDTGQVTIRASCDLPPAAAA
jgi:hypothetical protein